MVVVAVLALNIFNPAVCFGGSMDARSDFSWAWVSKRKIDRRRETVAEVDAALESGKSLKL